jgi:Ti-type conjugative transfer relaxase TraA
VLGYAGTGKSYLLAAAREVWEESGYRVRGAALSGVATQNLYQSSGIESRTTASLFYSWDKGRSELTAWDVLVIDEAGMLGSRQMERIMTEAQDKGAKVVILGDWQQLQAIEAGAAFRAIAEEHHYIELKEVRRQSISWQREATVLLAKGQVEPALAKYQQHDQVHSFETQQETKERLIEQWNDVRHTHPQNSQLIMAYTRKDVKELNEFARQLKQRDGELGQSHSFDTSGGLREFATGDRVYFLKRDDFLGVINGTLGTITAIESRAGQIQVELDHDSLVTKLKQVTIDTSQYKHLDHGYAATVHKAQGVTVDRSYLLTSKYYDAHSTYVGMSRHRESCDVFSSREQFKNEKELASSLSRNRTKDVTLDYTKPWLECVHQREIQPDPLLDSLLSLHNRFEQHASFYENQAKVFLDTRYEKEREQFWQEADKFMSKFEQAHPEVAKRIHDSLIPEHEKQAIEYMKQFEAYSRNLSKLKSQDLRDFTKLTREIMDTPAVINHISCRNQQLAMQIKETFKQHEVEHSMRYEHSLSLSM